MGINGQDWRGFGGSRTKYSPKEELLFYKKEVNFKLFRLLDEADNFRMIIWYIIFKLYYLYFHDITDENVLSIICVEIFLGLLLLPYLLSNQRIEESIGNEGS